MAAKKPSELSILRGDDHAKFRDRIAVAVRHAQLRRDKANREYRQRVANSTFDNPNSCAVNPFVSIQKMSGFK